MPILYYDLWTLIPTKHALNGWSSLVCNSVFTAVRGPKDRHLLAALNPHQLNMTALFVHTLARDALGLVLDEPLTEFYDACRNITFNTP
eukprot:2856918-Amphidinium_carterae.2